MSRRQHYLHGLLALAVALSPLTGVAQEPDTSTGAVVKAASAYIAEYQRSLTSVVAEESQEQAVLARTPADREAARLRRTSSDVFFMFTPDTNEWMAIRDVTTVDGVAVADRRNVRGDLETLGDRQVAAALKAQNSRFNIGRVTRNFSEPTLSLLVLDTRHQHRFKFERRRVQKEGDATLVTVEFTEKESPTLIWDATRGKILSTGEVVIEAGSGRVRETTFRAHSGNIKVELTTKYAADERLGMWVPASFRESYEGGRRPRTMSENADYEHVVAVSTYSNYRRFQTTVRIK